MPPRFKAVSVQCNILNLGEFRNLLEISFPNLSTKMLPLSLQEYPGVQCDGMRSAAREWWLFLPWWSQSPLGRPHLLMPPPLLLGCLLSAPLARKRESGQEGFLKRWVWLPPAPSCLGGRGRRRLSRASLSSFPGRSLVSGPRSGFKEPIKDLWEDCQGR